MAPKYGARAGDLPANGPRTRLMNHLANETLTDCFRMQHLPICLWHGHRGEGLQTRLRSSFMLNDSTCTQVPLLLRSAAGHSYCARRRKKYHR